MKENESRKVIATSPEITKEEEEKRVEELVEGLISLLHKRKTA